MSSNPITQVSQSHPLPNMNLQPQLLTRLQLDLRGVRFTVDRETIMSLPESVLLCLFPNGLVLSRQSMTLSDGGDDEDDEVYGVDFDPECFNFVLSFFRHAADRFYGTGNQPGLLALQQHLLESFPPSSDFAASQAQNPLLTKQAIIVLREELEYFSIPPRDGGPEKTDPQGNANQALLDIKRACGQNLLEKRTIFAALQRNVNKENNVAEQHLIDMLCQSGFDRDDVWGYRAIEPSRCCISSIALVLLKTGITHNPDAAVREDRISMDYTQMSTAQKLLLFWRKPARKCWWDGIDVNVAPSGISERLVKLWARRVWTLELSLVSWFFHSGVYFLIAQIHRCD
ncbi:hypothetical protein BU17DRAFT_35704 [Hysterangium stoloniferum]|nr:hypothetical protein BU17DRAFT_35704 [Hysterangium stoloniferum]